MGTYDMAVGKKVVSAFSGPADVSSFDMISHVPTTKTIKAKKTDERAALEQLYKKVRDYREKQTNENLELILDQLILKHKQDWLLSLEIVELTKTNGLPFYDKALQHLLSVQNNRPEIAHLITNGLNLL